MPKLEFLKKKGVAALICQGAGLGFVFLAQIALARTLGAESYGVLAYVNAWLLALGIAARFGLDTVVLRDAGIHVSSQNHSGLHGLLRLASRSVLSIGVILGVVLLAGVFILVPPEQVELRIAFAVGALWLPLQSLSAIRASALLALGKVWTGLAPDYLIRPIVLGAGVLAFGMVAKNVDAVAGIGMVILSSAVAMVVGQVALARALPEKPGEIHPPERGQFLSSAWSLLMFNGSSQLLYQVDTIVVGLTIHPHAAGTYYAAKQLALVASLALIALQWTSAPSFAALWAKGEKSGLQDLLTKVALRGFAFSLIYVVFCGLLGKFVLRFFGPEFVGAYPILMILAVAQLCAAAGGAVGQLAAMAGLQVVGGSIYLVATFCLAATAPVAIVHFGVAGAAFAALLVTCSWVIALNVIVWKKLGVVAALRPFGRRAGV